jgi:hypothetical protein
MTMMMVMPMLVGSSVTAMLGFGRVRRRVDARRWR